MKNIIKKLLLAVLIVTQTSPAQPSLSRTAAVGGAIVGGVASGAVGYGIFTVLEKMYDKSRKGIPLSAEDHEAGQQILKQVGEELAQEEEDNSGIGGRSTKRTILMSIVVLTTAILGGGLTFQFLDGYTNKGRLAYAEKIMSKIDNDELLELIAGNEDWHEDAEIINKICIKFGEKAPMTGLKKHIDVLLGQVTTADKGLKAIHKDWHIGYDDVDSATVDEIDEKTQEKLTALRDVSEHLDRSPDLFRYDIFVL